MKISLRELRCVIKKLVKESVEEELNAIEVGDVVDVEDDEMGIVSVRVLELVDDVNQAAGAPDPRNPGAFVGPGFVGEIDPDSGESGTLVFSLNQVVPGSKAKGYFPKDEFDSWDRALPNPYRKWLGVKVTSISAA